MLSREWLDKRRCTRCKSRLAKLHSRTHESQAGSSGQGFIVLGEHFTCLLSVFQWGFPT